MEGLQNLNGSYQDIDIETEQAADLLKKGQAQIKEQSARIADLQFQLRNAKRSPTELEDYIEEARKKVLELERRSAEQANVMNFKFTDLMAAMNQLDGLKSDTESSKNNEDLRGLLRDHQRLLDQVKSAEERLVSVGDKLQGFRELSRDNKQRQMDHEEQDSATSNSLLSAIIEKEEELQKWSQRYKASISDLQWVKASASAQRNKVSDMGFKCKTEELEAHVKYMEAINRISVIEGKLDFAQQKLSALNQVYDIQAHRLQVAEENSKILNYSIAGQSYRDQTALQAEEWTTVTNVYPDIHESPDIYGAPVTYGAPQTAYHQDQFQTPYIQSPASVYTTPQFLNTIQPPPRPSSEAQVYFSDTPPPLPPPPQGFSLGSRPNFSPPQEVPSDVFVLPGHEGAPQLQTSARSLPSPGEELFSTNNQFYVL